MVALRFVRAQPVSIPQQQIDSTAVVATAVRVPLYRQIPVGARGSGSSIEYTALQLYTCVYGRRTAPVRCTTGTGTAVRATYHIEISSTS